MQVKKKFTHMSAKSKQAIHLELNTEKNKINKIEQILIDSLTFWFHSSIIGYGIIY